jgi:YD repeat-containing protein
MANRSTRFILKNNPNSAAPFSGATLYAGEPIVNTAAGIMMFSGVTSGTNDWVPAGPSGNANFFEVGSNLYNLKIRNQITTYAGLTNLAGKFLSGTTSGFVLADIASITGVDTYVTGYTYSNNTFTIKQNNGQADLTALINTMTGLTVNGTLSATTYVGNGSGLTGIATVTGGTPNNSTRQYVFTNSTGGTFNVDSLLDVVVTGGTVAYVGSAGTATFTNSTGGTFNVTGFKDVSTTGATFNAGTATFTKNDGTTYSLTGITATDTYVTGFTYNAASNLITLSQNQGQVDKTINITAMSGLTLSNLTAGRVPYVGTGGLLTDEAGFTYDASTNVFSVPSDGTVNVGTGGLNVAGNAVIQGSLTVFGPSVSAFTSELYVEDPNITLNYNPTGNTTATSIGAGWMIQDGNGVNGGNVNLNINRLDTLTGLTVSNTPSVTEYVSATGYANRGWITQLNDIVIRSTNVSTPNGVRVLAEFDVLDGGTY